MFITFSILSRDKKERRVKNAIISILFLKLFGLRPI